jgi:hypothetical protein
MEKENAKAKRVVFTFDERSLEGLEELKKTGGYGTLADTVRDSLRMFRAIKKQSNDGFTEILVRNPKTGSERVMVLP